MSKNDSVAPGRNLVRRCLIFYLAALIGLWLIALLGIYVRAHLIHQPVTLDSLFIFQRHHSYSDFLDFNPVTQRFRPESTSPTVVYPAPMMCAYFVFTRLFAHPLRTFFLFVLMVAFSAAACLGAALARSAANRGLFWITVAASLFLSFPLMFVIERSNMECVVWAVQILGLFAFLQKRYWLAGLLIALAASMKVYPGLLFLLFLPKKRYKELAVSAVAFAAYTLAALQIIRPSIPQALVEVQTGLARVKHTHMVSFLPAENWQDHSLFSVVKVLVTVVAPADLVRINHWIERTAAPYSAVVVIGFGAFYWLCLRKLPLLNQTIALLLLSVSLPFMSNEYTLLQLYPGWACLMVFLATDVTEGRVTPPYRSLAQILAGFAFLFAPLGYLNGHVLGVGGQLKTFCILALVYLVSRTPLPSSLFGDNTSSSNEPIYAGNPGSPAQSRIASLSGRMRSPG